MNTTTVRTNRDVALAMFVTGLVFVVVAVVLTFASNWLATFVNGGSGVGTSIVLHLWSIAVQLGYPLGSFLIVGAIIVNRLPERPVA
jgi:hypothetical protein